MFSFGVVGAGIIGATVARELQRRYPESQVTVIDKARDVGTAQTGHNSGVVHAGLYYQPGSLKAQLCRRGVQLLSNYARTNGLPYEECGKLVVATNQLELERLEAIYDRAVANGVPGVEMIDAQQIRDIEPEAIGIAALHSPHTAITDYRAITRAVITELRQAGAKIHTETTVVGVDNSSQNIRLQVEHRAVSDTLEFDRVIFCTGLQSDRTAVLAGGRKYPKIIPFFGQYSRLEPAYRNILNGLVYPVPDPAYPFLGVHLTKRVDGEMLVGPNAFLSFGREIYSGIPHIKDSLQIATEPGFWKFAARNIPAAVRELGGVISKKRFLEQAATYSPNLRGAQATPITRGIRAQALDAQGQLVDDFVIEHVGRATMLRNAPSPGATSSFAIAEYLVDQISNPAPKH